MKNRIQYLNNFGEKFNDQFVNYYSDKNEYEFNSFKDVEMEMPEEEDDEEDY